MTRIIDRRLNAKHKSTVNRQRFLRRYREQIKQSVDKAISQRGITEIDKGEKITLPRKNTSEPFFYHGPGGQRDIVCPGNKEFIAGDHIKRPPQGNQGQGGQASNQGEGEDDFVFELSREEFLDLFFDDLALPDLIKRDMAEMLEFKNIRAGFTRQGVPTNIHVIRSLKQATARRMALGGSCRRELRVLEKEYEHVQHEAEVPISQLAKLAQEIDFLKTRLKKIPFIDTVDLRYSSRIKQPMPTTQAVMFCLMDVSGSMDETKKEVAKRFFILLYLFLTRNYEKISIVFIRHHTSAKEVNEEEFFYSRETGGTVVSSALELMRDIIETRYPPQLWNIYAAQASDGDNWNADSPYCQKLLTQDIIPQVQYFAYIEIMPRHHQSLWEAYTHIKQQWPQFAMQHIDNIADIYPVFRELFKKESV